MDIKPFNQPVLDYWAALGPFTCIMVSLGVLAIIAAVITLIIHEVEYFFISLTVFFCLYTIFTWVVSEFKDNRYEENYNNAVNELKTSLSNDGFKVVSGTPDLHPNTQSPMLLSYGSKNFDCTMFSPADVNANVVFSCGETKLTLTQIKQEQEK
jgi:hypothetical protein